MASATLQGIQDQDNDTALAHSRPMIRMGTAPFARSAERRRLRRYPKGSPQAILAALNASPDPEPGAVTEMMRIIVEDRQPTDFSNPLYHER